MSGSYTAWNGRTYPWPPPDGWYRGPDGRWWAPGSGPGSGTGDTTSRQRPVDRTAPGPGEPIDRTPANQGADGPGRRPPATASTPIAPLPRVTAPTRRMGRPALVAVAALALIAATGAVAGLALDRNRPPDDDAATVSAGTTSTTTSPSPPSASTSPSSTSSGDTAGAPATIPADTDDTPTPDPPTSTAVDSTTAPEASAPTPAIDPVAQFRQLVGRADLDTDLLTDRDVRDFGQMLCFIATVEDPSGYRSARDQLAAEQTQTGTLTVDEAVITIDAAIAAFCPDEASRLGLVS